MKTFIQFLNEQTSKGTYIALKVMNAGDVFNHFKEQGVPNLVVPEELHSTVAYSRKEIDLDCYKITPIKEDAVIYPQSMIELSPLGDEGAYVLKYGSDIMQDKFQKALDCGGIYDYDNYIPHITISYNIPEDFDMSNITLPDFPIILGNEYSEELGLD